jgi:hypothetical protein
MRPRGATRKTLTSHFRGDNASVATRRIPGATCTPRGASNGMFRAENRREPGDERHPVGRGVAGGNARDGQRFTSRRSRGVVAPAVRVHLEQARGRREARAVHVLEIPQHVHHARGGEIVYHA